MAAILQPMSGDISAKFGALKQPAKLAAMEVNFHSRSSAPLLIGGIPDVSNEMVNYGIEIPGLLSYMAFGDTHHTVKGLDAFPAADRPPVAITHYAFQIMVFLGMMMLALSIIYIIAITIRKSWVGRNWLLSAFVAAVPVGFIAVEAGWTVTEVGRQPWIIYGYQRTQDAATLMPGIGYTFYLFAAIYVSLSCMIIFLLYRQIKMVPVLYALNNALTAQ